MRDCSWSISREVWCVKQAELGGHMIGPYVAAAARTSAARRNPALGSGDCPGQDSLFRIS